MVSTGLLTGMISKVYYQESVGRKLCPLIDSSQKNDAHLLMNIFRWAHPIPAPSMTKPEKYVNQWTGTILCLIMQGYRKTRCLGNTLIFFSSWFERISFFRSGYCSSVWFFPICSYSKMFCRKTGAIMVRRSHTPLSNHEMFRGACYWHCLW